MKFNFDLLVEGSDHELYGVSVAEEKVVYHKLYRTFYVWYEGYEPCEDEEVLVMKVAR